MLTVTLRQEIVDGTGISVKQFDCFAVLPGKRDMQMYDVYNNHGGPVSMRINRNNILSIVERKSDESNKSNY